ncbi:MAG: alcohol dehydrogenase catalytic domain-containing protein [Pseudonocardia sp.]|nr:alcohol dehydrogenase catalytic domain-containing protein [Pseudonocardia sp.]
MRAAWYPGPGSVSLAEVHLPDPGPHDVLVDVLACGICGSNLSAWQRGPGEVADGPTGGQVPGANGHELAARVAAVGSAVTGVRPGQDVVVDPSGVRSCGECEACADGADWFCSRPRRAPAFGFADRMIVPERALLPTPTGLDPVAAVLAEPIACGVHAVRHSWTASATGRVDGRTVAVLGAGLLGLGSIMAAKALGAASVVVVARHPHQAETARALGADEVLLDAAPDTAETVRKMRPALVVEAAGGTDTFATAMRVVAWRGEVAVLGHFGTPQRLDTDRAGSREQRIFFPVSYAARDGVADLAIALDLLAASPAAAAMVTHRVPLDEIDRAFRVAADKTSGALRVAVVP